MKNRKVRRVKCASEARLGELLERNAEMNHEREKLARLYERNKDWRDYRMSLEDINDERAFHLVVVISGNIRGHLCVGDRSDAWFGKWLRVRLRLLDKYTNERNGAMFHIDGFAI